MISLFPLTSSPSRSTTLTWCLVCLTVSRAASSERPTKTSKKFISVSLSNAAQHNLLRCVVKPVQFFNLNPQSLAKMLCNAFSIFGGTNEEIAPWYLATSFTNEEETTASSGLVGKNTVSTPGARILLALAKVNSYSKSETDLIPRIRIFAPSVLAIKKRGSNLLFALLFGKQSFLGRIYADTNDQLITKRKATFDDINVPICQRIKSAGVYSCCHVT